MSDYSHYYHDINVEYSKKTNTKNRKGSVGKSEGAPDQNLVLMHSERIQTSVSKVEDEIKRSACDHQKVHESLKQVKDAISFAIGDFSQPSSSSSNRSQNLTRIKRSTSIAVEALAYQ